MATEAVKFRRVRVRLGYKQYAVQFELADAWSYRDLKSMTQKTLEKFKKWLEGHGAEILVPTNEWEVIRFRANEITSIVYRTKSGSFTYVGEAEAAFDAYRKNVPGWKASARVVRNGVPNVPVRVKALRQRDGDNCFFCGRPIPLGEESVEHLLAQVHGGTNHINNLALAHKPCNQAAGHGSIMAKILKRENTIGLRVAGPEGGAQAKDPAPEAEIQRAAL